MARLFDGVSGIIGTQLTTNANNRSWSIWVDRESAGEGNVGSIFTKGVTDSLVVAGAGTTIAYNRLWTGGPAGWSFTFSSSGWHHIGLTYNSSSATNDPIFYLDGVAQSLALDGNSSGTRVDTAQPYNLGNSVLDNATWDGSLAEFAVWDGILTAADMVALAKGLSPLKVVPQTLVSYMPLIGVYLPETDRKFPMSSGAIIQVGGTIAPPGQSDHPSIRRDGPVNIDRSILAPAEEEGGLVLGTPVPIEEWTFPSTPVLDTFDRADEDPATGWTDYPSGAGLEIISNQLAAGSTGQNGAYFNTSMTGPDVEAYITISTLPTDIGSTVLYARNNPAAGGVVGNNYSVRHTYSSAGLDLIFIARHDSGASTTLATVSQDLSAGDKLGIRCIGSLIQAWASISGTWTLIASVTDTTYSGLGDQNKLAVTHFEATGPSVRWNDFGGGVIDPFFFSSADLILTPVNP